LDGIFIGATETRAMRNAMILSVAGYALALWLTQPLGNHGLWASMFVLYGLRAATLGALYPRIPRTLEV
ncbi:MAG: MATE family efflux transporter, partial [Rhodobacteraceae bacterium]|nr:MATE family efflux transporter [Paracoccaceae bacterium]